MSPLAELEPRYRVILCDLWGCVHDGTRLFPGVVERLDEWVADGRLVMFLTNAPRPSAAVAGQLTTLGLPDRLNGAIASSGDAAVAWLAREGSGRTLGFLGSAADRERLATIGLIFADKVADTVLCAGFDERGFDLSLYQQNLSDMHRRGAEMLCLNPDRIVHRGGVPELCAGALADAYSRIGGVVRWFGKPYPAIYNHALDVAASLLGRVVELSEILAIGDSIMTDYRGAVGAGIDFVFVSSGIDHEGYASKGQGLFELSDGASPNPVAIVDMLGRAA